MVITFVILAITILLFISGKPRPDIVALLSVMALLAANIIDVGQALSGFSNTTVIMIAALFVVGEGLSATGVTTWLSEQLLKLAGSSQLRLLVVLMVGTALLSAFMSNTGTVAALLPAVVAAAWRIKSVPAKFLIPLAFAANMGGLLTLTGTPPNIVVAETLSNAGLRPFSFFEYSLVGIPLLTLGIIYISFAGWKLLPSKSKEKRPTDLETSLGELTTAYALHGELYRLRVRPSSTLVGQTLAQAGLGKLYGVSVLQIEQPQKAVRINLQQPGRIISEGLQDLQQQEDSAIPRADTKIKANDILLAKGTEDAIQDIMAHFKLGMQPLAGEDETAGQLTDTLLSYEVGIAEVLVTPRSTYIGQTLADSQFAQKFDVHVLSIRRNDKPVKKNKLKLAFGDSLLVRGTWDAISHLGKETSNFVVVGRPEEMAKQVVELNPHAFVALLALTGMVVLMVTGWTSTVIATVLAALVMILTGCLSTETAYRSISLSTVILVAAMMPMSTALEVTGGAEFLADSLVNTLGTIHPIVLLAGIFLLTTGFSQVITNTATVVLVAPIVLQAAIDSNISPHSALMIVAVAASAAFLTPIASPVNTLVLNPGGYSFGHYVKVGIPLIIIFFVVSLTLVPLIWPL